MWYHRRGRWVDGTYVSQKTSDSHTWSLSRGWTVVLVVLAGLWFAPVPIKLIIAGCVIAVTVLSLFAAHNQEKPTQPKRTRP